MTDKPKKEKTYHVRLSRPGDKQQEMEVEEYRVPRPNDKPEKRYRMTSIINTSHYVNMEKRLVVRREGKKYNLKELGIIIAPAERTHYGDDTAGQKPVVKPVVNKSGKPIPNSVQEADIPESMMHKLQDGVNRGCLIVEGIEGEQTLQDIMDKADEDAGKPQLKYTSKALGAMTSPEVRGIASTEYKLDIEGKAKSALVLEIMEAQGVKE